MAEVSFPLELFFNTVAGISFLIYWGMVFVIFYHMTRFGIGVQPKRLAAIFLLGSVVLSGAAMILFITLDVNALFKLIPTIPQ